MATYTDEDIDIAYTLAYKLRKSAELHSETKSLMTEAADLIEKLVRVIND